MSHTIHKFRVDPQGPTLMNDGAQVLSVGVQFPDIVLWAIVDPHLPLKPVPTTVVGTGHDCAEDPDNFVGTVQMHDGLVFHVFVEGGRA